MAKEWVPGVVVLERGWLSSNNIVLRAPAAAAVGLASARASARTRAEAGVAVVVDTGHVKHAAQTVALLEEVMTGCDPVAVLNTHLHSDHCGGNAAVAARFNVPVFIPPGDFDAALAWDEARLSFEETGQCCERFVPTAQLVPGHHLPAPFDRWEIHAAAGHDPASIILFDPVTRVVISADALWENGFGIVFPVLQGVDAFADVEASLDVIEGLKPASVIPGHGAPFTDVAAALARARARLSHFRNEPRRHALHAAKALMVFRVMEAEAIGLDELVQWAGETPIFRKIGQAAEQLVEQADEVRGDAAANSRGAGAGEWVRPLIEELLRTGSLRPSRIAGKSAVLTAV